MSHSVLVAIGGLIGSVARYWLAGVVQRLNNSGFPVGTMTVNLIGSFLVGLVIALSIERGLLNANLRIFLAAGFCGGFTTMSTFSYETLALLRDGSTAAALGNLGATIIGCLMAVWLGNAAARWL